jgi:phenylalanyl-tRNA synthetase alpha chain
VVELEIDQLRQEIETSLRGVKSTADLELVRLRFLGRKGPIQEIMKSLRELSPEARPVVGKAVNDLKQFFEERASELEAALRGGEESARLESERIDVTLPGRRSWLGSKHPVVQLMDELTDIFIGMGFSIELGPEVESDYYNFEALNFPPDHPAREMQDTFYIAPGVLLRTHVTNVQSRILERGDPPLRIASPGRCYRNEDINPRSHLFFHQVDGFYVDKGVTLGDLKATIRHFLTRLMGDLEVRFRPSFFPFVEPGLEVDVRCTACGGTGCQLCKGQGWLEVMGAGMIHPEVLLKAGIDPEVYSGFAWGLGVERLVLLRYGVPDIRLLLSENDVRFLEQFTGQ